MNQDLLINICIAAVVSISLIVLFLFLAREFTDRRWKARIFEVREALVGLYGVQGDALEPLWPTARAAIAAAIGDILCQPSEHISVRPRQHPGKPQICGVLVILRGPASNENPRLIARLEMEIRASLPAWAFFKFAVAPPGIPLPIDRLTEELS